MDGSNWNLVIEKDFQRKVYSVLGLPFDALVMSEAVACVQFSIDEQQSCFISTPNLNFLKTSQSDTLFRKSVINSDLSLADGMPLIWIARLLRIPLIERVPGSGLIEALMCSGPKGGNPVKVFLFGGEDGVADLACEKLDKNPCGICCAGSLNPGFGSVEEMSEPGIIECINKSDADFVIVSLGAQKGQEWIERNRHQLDAPVISHLGAVVNFLAGTVDRAPVSWQRFGLEWLWRIKEEPTLWKRYFSDGLAFLKLLCYQVLPYALLICRKQRLISTAPPFSIDVMKSGAKTTLSINGLVTSEHVQSVRDLFMELVPGEGEICIELADTAIIDASFCGLVMILYKHVGERLSLVSDSGLIRKELVFNKLDFLLE